MHDLKTIRQDPCAFQTALERRGEKVKVQELLDLDEEKRQLTARLDELRRRRNEVSQNIGRLRKTGEDSGPLEAEMRRRGEDIKTGEERERELEAAIRRWLLNWPNLPAESTPSGLSSEQNVVLRVGGEAPAFDFTPREHLDVAERLHLLDFRRGGKIAGSGFPVWTNRGAQIERALWNFMLDIQTREHGYTEMLTPLLANHESMEGSGQIPRLEEDMYHCPREDLFLIPTSEVPLINLHREEILNESDLPLKYTALSPCFRREAGAYGHTTRGFQRVHQFNKVELVRFERPEDSNVAWEEMINHAEEVLRRLDLRYRVLRLCAGDMGFNAAACCDLEVWAPAEGGRWLEASSCSNCEDFQARRANIRYRPRAGGKARHPHILNGSGVATSRLMVALLETHQTDEGSWAVPPALRPYLNGLTVITAD